MIIQVETTKIFSITSCISRRTREHLEILIFLIAYQQDFGTLLVFKRKNILGHILFLDTFDFWTDFILEHIRFWYTFDLGHF